MQSGRETKIIDALIGGHGWLSAGYDRLGIPGKAPGPCALPGQIIRGTRRYREMQYGKPRRAMIFANIRHVLNSPRLATLIASKSQAQYGLPGRSTHPAAIANRFPTETRILLTIAAGSLTFPGAGFLSRQKPTTFPVRRVFRFFLDTGNLCKVHAVRAQYFALHDPVGNS